MRNAVHHTVCIGLIRSELAGYQGYPNTEAGEIRFARALQEVSVSVAHASAILAKFTQKFPTVQDILDTGLNLLPEFEIQHSQLVEWEKEYGPRSPIKPDFATDAEPEYVRRDRDAKRYLTLKHGGTFPGFAKIGWIELFEAYEACGYPLNTEQKKMIGRE
jgi:hypothetical protein